MAPNKPLPKSATNAKPPHKKRIDWPAAKAEYVNNAALTCADIAKKYGAHEGNVRQRAARENWTAERSQKTAILLQKVTEKSVLDTVAELIKYNEQDLVAAKALRGIAARQMQNPSLEPKDVRALAGALESAQRVARLALGASTANTDTRSTIIDRIEQMSPEERRYHARDLYSQIFSDIVQ